MNHSPTVDFLTRMRTVLAAVLLSVSAPSLCSAGGGPENVFLLVNSRSTDSITVANHYVHLRKIPPSNVFYLSYPPSAHSIKSKPFRDKILLPVLKEINRRKLHNQIDYLIYSCDFPWRVMFNEDYPEQKFSGRQRPWTSITGASYLWAFSKQPNRALFSLNNNFYHSPLKGEIPSSRALQAQYRWTRGGQRGGKEGIPYMLSAMLGVTGEQGNSVKEITNYLRKGSESDDTHPQGTIYFVKNKTVRSTPRHDLFPAAVRELGRMGIRARTLTGFFPQGKLDIMGATTGGPRLNIGASRCRFLPGAFCDNLTSYGGVFVLPRKRKPNYRPQTNVCESLRYGASAACGTVVEPTNDPRKFPTPFFHIHYARGCSLGEAFYRSLSAPYQQILVGDPLCQPWAKAPKVAVAGIESGDWIQGEVQMSPSAKVGERQEIRRFELFVDGMKTQACKLGGAFSLDTKKWADGYHELRVVAIEKSPIETQGRWIGMVIVNNGNKAVRLSVDPSQIKNRSKQLSIQVASTTKKTVTVLHHGQVLGQVEGGNGSLQIEASKLGSGPVVLYGTAPGTPELRSQPLSLVLP